MKELRINHVTMVLEGQPSPTNPSKSSPQALLPTCPYNAVGLPTVTSQSKLNQAPCFITYKNNDKFTGMAKAIKQPEISEMFLLYNVVAMARPVHSEVMVSS